MLLENYDIIVVVLGALLGTTKANMTRDEPWYERIVDLMLGLFCGISAGLYFSTPNPVLPGLIALASAMLGANLLEAFLQATPKELRTLVLKWLLGK